MASVHQMLVNNVLSPMDSNARTLFTGQGGSEDQSTQGTSNGAVNSPKVASESAILCVVCNEEYNSREEVTIHMNEDHDNEESAATNDNDLHDLSLENELIEEAKREQDLYDSLFTDLDDIALTLDDPKRIEEMQEKMKRLQIILKKKSELQFATTEVIKKFKHENKLSAQVEANQLKELDEKDMQKDKLAKEVKAGRDELKAEEEKIKQLTEALKNEEPEVTEVINQTMNMNKETSGHKCNSCYSGKVKT